MADTKITALTANAAPLLTDILPMVDDPGGTPATQKITIQNLRRQLFPYGVCGGRLTLTTATPVTTADVTAAGMLYFTPYSKAFGCGQIGLYDGSSGWDVLNFTELSLNISAYTASKPYDIWVYNNSGTAAMESTVWTNATTRATALALQDGVYVKNGATTRRYVGTIYINASGGQTDDSITKRNVFNYYNRVLKYLYVKEATDNWTYNTNSWRQANGAAGNQFEVTVGVSEDMVSANVAARYNGISTAGSVGIGIDATNANSALIFNDNAQGTTSGYAWEMTASYKGFLAVGYHYIAWLEYARAGTIAIQGDAGIPTSSQSGMVGECWC